MISLGFEVITVPYITGGLLVGLLYPFFTAGEAEDSITRLMMDFVLAIDTYGLSLCVWVLGLLFICSYSIPFSVIKCVIRKEILSFWPTWVAPTPTPFHTLTAHRSPLTQPSGRKQVPDLMLAMATGPALCWALGLALPSSRPKCGRLCTGGKGSVPTTPATLSAYPLLPPRPKEVWAGCGGEGLGKGCAWSETFGVSALDCPPGSFLFYCLSSSDAYPLRRK